MHPTEGKPESELTKNKSGRIVLFADRLSPSIGGMEAHADAFIKYFGSHLSWQLSLVLTFERGALPHTNEILGQSEGECEEPPAPIKFLTKTSIFNPQEVFTAIDPLKLAPGDIIFFNSLYWVRILRSLHDRYPHVRIIMRSGGNDIAQSQIEGAGESLRDRQQFVADTINSAIDCLIVNSSYSYATLSKVGIESNRMKIVRGGVDIFQFTAGLQDEREILRRELSLPNTMPIILAACRLVPFKGLEDSISAIKLIPRTIQFHYVIVGDGPLKSSLTEHIKSSGLEDRVTLHTAVRHEDIPRYFRAADIYCLTPILQTQKVSGGEYIHTETMGRSFCEAAAASLPSVSTQVGGIPEIVLSGETGFLVPEKTPKLIATGLSTLLLGSSLRERMGEQARTISEINYSWETVFGSYCNIFQK